MRVSSRNEAGRAPLPLMLPSTFQAYCFLGNLQVFRQKNFLNRDATGFSLKAAMDLDFGFGGALPPLLLFALGVGSISRGRHKSSAHRSVLPVRVACFRKEVRRPRPAGAPLVHLSHLL